MRRNRKWKSSARDFQADRTNRAPFTLIAQLDELRWALTAPDNAAAAADTTAAAGSETVLALDRAALIDPFLALVTSPETNGHITCLALSAVERLVDEGVLDPPLDAELAASVPGSPIFDAAPIHSVVHALTHCRFEPSDSSRDEVVLARLLSLSRAVLFSRAGSFLSNRAVWRLLQNLYAVHAQLHMRGAGGGGEHYSQVLAEQAEETMVDLVTRVAQQVNEQIEREQAEIKAAQAQAPPAASALSAAATAAHSLASFAASSGMLQIPSRMLHPSPSVPAYPPSHHMSPVTTSIQQSFDNIPTTAAAPTVAASSRSAPSPAEATSSPPLSCRTPLIFNSASSTPNVLQHAYGLPVLRKVFELVASLCESVHTDLNVALKIDLVHGVHGEGTRQLEQEHAAATAAQAAAAAARAAEDAAVAAEEERNDTANTTATDATTTTPAVDPSPRPLSPSPTSPLLTPAPPAATPAPSSAAEGPSVSPPTASSAAAAAASSPFPPSSLPPYSSASYRCLLPISELSTLGFFALPLPGGATSSNGGHHHHHSSGGSSLGQSLVSTLNSGMIGGGGSSSAAAADALSNWHKRCHLTLRLLDALLSTLGRKLLAAPGLLSFMQDAFMKFLLKNTHTFSSLAGVGASGTSSGTGSGGAGSSTFHLPLFSRSLALVQQALVLYRDALPAQMEIVVQSVYLRIIGIKLVAPSAPSAPGATTAAAAAGGVAGTPSKGSASSFPSGSTAVPLDPSLISSLYELQECVLESLLDLLSLPWFLPELFVNFDANAHTATNLGEEIMRAIVRGIFPATNVPSAAGATSAAASSEEAGEEGLLAASSVAASFAAAALAAGAPVHDGSSGSPSHHHSSSDSSSGSSGGSGGGGGAGVGGFTHNHFLALRCVVENLKWIKLRTEAAANGWNAAAAKRPSYTAPQSPVAGSRSTQQQQQGGGECPSPSPSPAFSTSSAASGSSTGAAAPSAPGPHASLPEIASWLQFMECWVRAQPTFSNAAAIAAVAAGTAPETETPAQSAENASSAADASDLPNSLFRCLHAARLTKRLLRSCIAQFNASPTKGGLAGFQSSFGLLRDYATAKKEFRKASVLSPQQAREIDAFTRLLRCNSGFDKVAIGLFLAEPDMFSRHIRSRYCANNFAFTGMTIDDSLRMFLEAFRLPLEAQQIDRMMQSFAETYFAQNPEQGGLADGDAVHTLAFSIIMLNTDLHNDLIKNKMTLLQFISNNRGINHGQNVSPILLKSLYFSIKFNEIKMSGSASAAASAASEAGAAGGGGGGEVNDALWSDVIAQSSRMWIAPHVAANPQQQQQGRRYIRLDASDAQSREETHRAVMHLIESPSPIIPERLCSSIVPVCLPSLFRGERAGSSSPLSSDVLPCLLPLYADYLLFSSFGSAALASVTVVFELFLAPHMVVRHESRTRRDQEAARKRAAAKAAWEEQREREWREQAAAQAAAMAASNASSAGFSIHVSTVVGSDVPSGSSMLAASRQSSTDSEYCTVSTAGNSSADEGGEYDEAAAHAQSREGSPAAAALHTSASYPARLPGASAAQAGAAVSATRANHSASYESLSAMHSHFSSPPPVVRSPVHESALVASASTSLVSVLYSSFDSLATLCALYPLRFQSLFDKVVQALARFIGLSSHRGIVAAMGASGPSGVGIGDLAPPMSRALVLGNKYAALQGFGSNAKATLVTRWLLQVFLHRPLLLEAVRASWNDILRIVLALFYLEVLPQPMLESSSHDSATADGDASSSVASQDEEDSPDWILTNLEDFVAEWNEKFGAFVGIGGGSGAPAPNRRALSAGKIRKDLLSCVPLASQAHGSSRKFSSADRSAGGLSDSNGSSNSGGGGLGSSLLGLFFSSSSSPPPGQEVEAPFHKTVDMASHELSLRALVSSCNLPFILLEQSRSLSLPALRGMLAHIMELSVIRGVAAQNWTPSPAARERIAAQRMAHRTAMVAERHRAIRPSMMHSCSDEAPSPTSAAAAAAAAATASSRGSVLASLGLFEFDVLDEGLYVDLGEEAHIAHTLATNPAASLANLSPAHELGMHLHSLPASAVCSGFSSPLCSDCGVLDYLSLPFELRRAIFLLDLATKITMENGARVERMWGPIRKWMMGIIQGTTAAATTATNTGAANAAAGSGPQPVLLVSAAIVSLLSILTHLFHKENMREDLMHTLRAIIGPSATATATAAGAPNGASSSCRLDYFLSHSDICMQLVTGVHLFLARHGDSLRSSHDWECILGFVRATAEYPRAIFHGFALLWSLVKSGASSDEGSCSPAVTLHSFGLLIDTVLAFVRSRYASPRMALKAVELLETLYAHLRTLLAASASAASAAMDGTGSGQGSSGSNSPRGGASGGSGMSHPFLARIDSHPSMIFSPTMAAAAGGSGFAGALSTPTAAAAAASVSSSPRLLLSHVWKSYCKPLLLAFRCVSACATDRVRVLYNTYHFLQRQRAQQEHAAAAAAASSGSLGFGLLRASPPPPPAAHPSASQGPPVPLSDYVQYMVEWARVRQQCLLLLKSTLVSDEFAASVSECVAQFGAHHAPAVRAAAAVTSSPLAITPSSSAASAASHSWDSSSSAIASWCCACFWQLCLDEVLFPLLRDLSVSASQALFLETSAPFSLLRVGAVNMLSKVFLRQLPLLRQYNPAAGFATTWLTVLKTLDRYMQIGVHLQRQQTAQMQAMHHARATGHSHSTTHGPGGASSAGVPLSLLPVPGIDWSSESGLQLTESVAEALKNLVLVMRSQGVFDEESQGTTGAAAATSPAAAAQPQSHLPAPPAAAASSASTRAPMPLPAPTGELWSLTVGMLGPWLPFLPALQAEIMTTEQAEQQQQQQQQPAAAQNAATTETATDAAPPATAAASASTPASAAPPSSHSASPAAQRPPTVL